MLSARRQLYPALGARRRRGGRTLVLGTPVEYAAAEHYGYQRLRRPLAHRRAVLSLGEGRFVIVDMLRGCGSYRVSRRFVFAPQVSLSRHDDGEPRARAVAGDSPAPSLWLDFPDLADGERLEIDSDEAMALGQPLITSDWPLLRETFAGGTLHVDNSAAQIAAAVVEAVRERDTLRAEMRLWASEQRRLFATALGRLRSVCAQARFANRLKSC